MDFTDVSFSKELVAQDDDLVDRNVADMLIFPENSNNIIHDEDNRFSLAPMDLRNYETSHKTKKEKKEQLVNEYFILDNPSASKKAKHKNHDDGETSSIHNTNNNSFNFSNIFNQMNESAVNQSGIIFQ